jgi:hypothetical protein
VALARSESQLGRCEEGLAKTKLTGPARFRYGSHSLARLRVAGLPWLRTAAASWRAGWQRRAEEPTAYDRALPRGGLAVQVGYG